MSSTRHSLLQATTSNNMAMSLAPASSSASKTTPLGQNAIGVIACVRSGADDSGALVFQTANAGTLTAKARITEAGRFAVGTSSPASPFHVYQNDTATTSAAGVTIEQDGAGMPSRNICSRVACVG